MLTTENIINFATEYIRLLYPTHNINQDYLAFNCNVEMTATRAFLNTNDVPDETLELVGTLASITYLLNNEDFLKSKGISDDSIRKLTEGEVTIEYSDNPTIKLLNDTVATTKKSLIRWRVIAW